MAFAGELIKPFTLPQKATDEALQAAGAIGEADYGKLSQKDKAIIDQYYALTQYVIRGEDGLFVKKNYYIPKEAIAADVLPKSGMKPDVDPLIRYLKTPWITEEYVIELYKKCAIDGANRAVNYINHYRSQGKTINLNELVPLVINDANSREVYEGYFYGFDPIDRVYRIMDDASNKSLRGYAYEAIGLGAEMVVELIEEEMARLQDQAAAMQGAAPATQEPMTAGVGTVPLIGMIALLGFSLKTIAQKRRK